MHTAARCIRSRRESTDDSESGLSRLSSTHILLPSVIVPLIVLICCVVGCFRHHRRYKRHRSACSGVAGSKQPRHSASRTSYSSYLLTYSAQQPLVDLFRLPLLAVSVVCLSAFRFASLAPNNQQSATKTTDTGTNCLYITNNYTL